MSAFGKEVVRSVRHSLGRFIAIVIISFLGAGFFAGLRMAAPDMRLAGDEFFDATSLYDIMVISDFGLDEECLDLLRDVEGVEQVMGTYRADALVKMDGTEYVAQIESLPAAAGASDVSDGIHALSYDDAYLNRPILLEGEWPKGKSQCVVGKDAADKLGLSLGDTLRVAAVDGSVSDTFASTSFNITGLVNSSTFISKDQLGASELGAGKVELYMYTPKAAFASSYPMAAAYIMVAGAVDEVWGSAAYQDTVDEVADRIDDIAPKIAELRETDVLSSAQEELDDARDRFDRERADTESKISTAQDDLDDAEKTLTETQKKLEEGREQLEENQKRLNDTQKSLEASETEYSNNRQQVAAQRQSLQPQIDALPSLRAQRAELAAQPNPPADRIAQLDSQIASIEQAQSALQQAEASLAEARTRLNSGWEQYNDGLSKFQKALEEYNDGLDEYREGVEKYKSGKEELDANKTKADTEFADAEAELNDAQADIDATVATVFVIDRAKNPGAASLEHDADSISKIATFLPIIFFLVAALVVLTSMTRMVEEERMDIGTHKALGYSRRKITSKYMIYGGVSSALGSVLGVAILGTTLPMFIMTSYGISYSLPIYPTPLHPVITIIAVGISVIVALLATWGAASASLREKPAMLMLPKVPKAGKRILLERVSFLWRRLSFSHKVTARNILRYRRRFFMAVIGIAGCTALLIIGFGLRDSIGSIVDNQYKELQVYDAEIRLAVGDGETEKDAYNEALDAVDAIDGAEALPVEVFNMIGKGRNEQLRIEVIVPQDSSRITDFVNLRDRASGTALTLDSNGIILTEKAAAELGASVGSVVTLYDENTIGDPEGKGHKFIVAGIAENYLSHYAYMTSTAYSRAFGETMDSNRILVTLPDGTESSELEDALLEAGSASAASFTADSIQTYEEMLDVMNKLIIIVVILSAALAFVVLYNLTNINIAERTREIATLRVLGFTRREVDAYIFREIIIMVVIGAIIGCFIGIPLTFYVAESAETATLMFGRTIEPLSFLFAFLITLVFAFLVTLVMRPKLDHIDMVQSLKSVE